MKTIAIVCDCDNTLTHDSTSLLIKSNGIDVDQFWKKIDGMVKNGWDPPIAWMNEICSLIKEGKIAQNTNEKLTEFGKTVETFPGVTEFIPELNTKLKENGVDAKVEGYVVSCGMEHLMKGTKIAETFTDIFGSKFYEENGKITGVKSSVTFTEKTKFLFAINKGITSELRQDPFIVNKTFEERRIPFENMIYLGDGPSDIPCFAALKRKGGKAIGIKVEKEWHKEFEQEMYRRDVPTYKADYTEGSELREELEKTARDVLKKWDNK